MISANELRIGNWITALYFGYIGYHSNKREIIQVGSVDEEDDRVNITVDFEGERLFWGQTEPIELTKEILLKCGFTTCPYDNNLLRCPKGYYQVYLGDPLVFRTPGTSLVNVLHLHQLQNLYFALTGHELTYKP